MSKKNKLRLNIVLIITCLATFIIKGYDMYNGTCNYGIIHHLWFATVPMYFLGVLIEIITYKND